ncbi:MAG: hypothetical protein HY435_01565 [Candidatus Liptonbacteria bacterium]|nr:hypothetical protein [Candidatus Liptonbacteria bacterium]
MKSHTPNNFRIILLIGAIVFATVVVILLFANHKQQELIVGPQITPSQESVEVFVDNVLLRRGVQNSIYSTTLRPNIVLRFRSTINFQSLQLQINDSENVLVNEFHGATSFADDSVVFEPAYALAPQKYKLRLEYTEPTGSSKSLDFDLTIGYLDSFTTPLTKSKVWLIPKGNPADWFVVDNEKLLVQTKTTEYKHGSLAFLYPFSSDITVDFEFTPLGKRVGLVFYFLNSTRNEFVLGGVGNKATILFHHPSELPEIRGRSFEMTAGVRYHARFVRKDFVYQLAIRPLEFDEQVNPNFKFSASEVVLEYVDNDRIQAPDGGSDQVGLALWQNSDGVVIDNFYIRGTAWELLR